MGTGALLMEWHSLEHIPLQASYAPVTSDWDFFHINSVALDGDDGLLISARSTQTVYKLDRRGRILWRLGGRASDFAIGAGADFAWQHDARRQQDGTLTIFDNGATPAVERLSRGLILALDEGTMTADLVHQYTHPRVLAGSQGSTQLLPGGNVFVGWGEVPRVSEFDPAGRILFDALLGSAYQSYRAFRLPWSGRPSQAPAIAVVRDGNELRAYASWNGASEVERWQLLAGETPERLSVVASAPARGFETVLSSASPAPLLAVRALEKNGSPLGQSPVRS